MEKKSEYKNKFRKFDFFLKVNCWSEIKTKTFMLPVPTPRQRSLPRKAVTKGVEK